MTAPAALTPNPAALLSSELAEALTVLEREMLRRAHDYETPSVQPVGAKNLSPLSRRDRPYIPEELDTPRARRLARQERLRARQAARCAPKPASVPQPVPADPRARQRRFDADTRFLMRFCSIRKTILEAHLLNPNADPLPELTRFLPDDLVRAFTLAESALCADILAWDARELRPCQLDFDLTLLEFARLVAIRKSLLDLSRISPAPPEGFPGWNLDAERNSADDLKPPITPPGCDPLPVDDLGYPLALGLSGARPAPAPRDLTASLAQAFQPASSSPIRVHLGSSVVQTSSPSLPADPSAPSPASPRTVTQAFPPSTSFSNLRSQISNSSSSSPIRVHLCSSVVRTSSPLRALSRPFAVQPSSSASSNARLLPLSVRTTRSLRAVSLFLLSRARRYGAALLYLRPIHKNRLIFRFSLALQVFIIGYDPHIADPPPVSPGTAPPPELQAPPGFFSADPFAPDPPPLYRT